MWWHSALASAALFAIAFPPFALAVPAFVCLVPVAVHVARLADGGGSAGGAARVGFWFGLVGFACNLYWVAVALSLYTSLAVLGYVASLLWLAAFVAGAAAALFAARRATRAPLAILLPVVWTAVEVALTATGDLAFPWLPLGLSMTPFPRFAQLADLSGVHAVSFWLAATNGLLADAWLARERRAVAARGLLVAGGLAIAVGGYGEWRMRTIALRPAAPIAIVQPNIPQQEKWQAANRGRIVGILAALSRDRLRRGEAALVVWPEAALPGYMAEHPEWRDTLRALAAVGPTPILFGVLDAEPRSPVQADLFNAAMMSDTSGFVDPRYVYHKQRLVPIVERVPFLDPVWFRGLRFFGGFGRGADAVPFYLPFGAVGVLICYESTFPQLTRQFRRNGADVLVNITNDAWFGRTVAPYQHHAHLVLRAIESRVGIVRSANTGISGYIDPLGRTHGNTALFVPATRTYRAATTDVRSPYVVAGDWLGAASVAATLLLMLADAGAARRRRRTAAGTTPCP